MTEKRKKYLLESMKLDEKIVHRIEELCDLYEAEKYAIWLGKEAKKNTAILFSEDLRYIFDWAYSIRPSPDIFPLSFETALEKSKQWHNQLAENSKGIINNEEIDPKRVLYKCSDGKHFFYNLNLADLIAESDMMGHCVGTNEMYGVRMRKNKIRIISLRDEKNKAHVTIEIDLINGNTGQISGKGNSQPISKYNDFITELGIYLAGDSISENDLETLKKLSRK